MPSFLTQKGVSNIKNKIESAFVKRAWLGMASSEDGSIIGVATLDRAGLIPSTQLPSYVDDTIEAYFNGTNFYSDSAFTKKINGETGKIYVNIAENEYSNRTYRWSGSQYIEISKQLALGRDAYSAFRGDWGATLESYFSGGKAKQAIADENGNNIVSTYMPYRGGTFTGDVTHAANLILTNSKVIVGKDTNGGNVSLLSINTSNQVVIAYGAHNKYDTLIYGNKITAYGDICGQKGVSAKGIADFGLISGSGGGGGTAYTLNIVPSDSKVSIQLKGADGSSDTKEISIFSTSQAGIVAKAPSVGSVLRGNGWGTFAFSELASRPTTLGGYGITDAYTKSQIENGVFPNMRVGLADDLGDIEETLDEEYTFQPTANPNEIRDGYAQIESLKGNSLVWNQKIQNNFVSKTLLPKTIHTFNNANYVATHYYIIIKTQAFDSNKVYLQSDGVIGMKKIAGKTMAEIFRCDQSFTNYAFLYNDTDNPVDINCYVMIRDLTQMFGKGYEPTSVEEFERRCPKGMSMDYNDGEVIHFNGDIKSVGFNQWDEEWENGTIYQGNILDGYNNVISLNYIQVLPYTQYYFSCGKVSSYGSIVYYDYNKKWIKDSQVNFNTIFTTPNNAYYMRFIANDQSYGTTYNHDICINISDPDKNGTYEPYTEFRRDLPTELFDGGMKGRGTAYDEVYWDKAKRTNVKVQRFGKVDLGTLDYVRYPSTTGYEFETSNLAGAAYRQTTLISDIYTPIGKNISDAEMSSYPYGMCLGNNSSIIKFYNPQLANSSVSDFKAAMSGVMLYYELAEPIVEEIDIPYMDYQVSNNGTEEIVSDVPTTPFRGRVTYNFDTVGTVRQNRFDISTLKNFMPNGIANQAHKLATPRTIWGQSFDGSGNISGAMSGVTNINSTLYLSSSGKVGIATINPLYKLDVNGSFNASSGFIGGKDILHAGNTSLALEKTGTDVTGFNLEVNDVEVGFSEITDAEINEIFSSWNV